jgi:hypothetical protein
MEAEHLNMVIGLYGFNSTMNGFSSTHKITIWAENRDKFAESWN